MKKIFHDLFLFFLLIIMFSCSSVKFGETKKHLNHVKYLASDDLEGRKPGTEGGKKAAEYIKNTFVKNGLELYEGTGFQYFDVTTNAYLGSKNALSYNDIKFNVDTDFIPLSFGQNTSLDTSIFIAGYGFDFSNDSLEWNDYRNENCKGKWVMILRGSPDENNPHGQFYEHSSLRKKSIVAKDNEAAGVIFVSSSNFDQEDKLIKLSYDQSQNDIGIPIIHIRRNIADQILKNQDTSVDELEFEAKSQKNKFVHFSTNERLFVTTDVGFEKKKTQNVIGFLPGKNAKLKEEYIVIGAHYDHIGYGGDGSGSRRPYINAVHNGADDNASGVSVILELSEMLSKVSNQRTIYFVAFGAEEMGLIGSKYFVNSNFLSSEKIQIMINLDMIGRLNDKKTLSIGGTKTAENLEKIIKASVNKSSLNATYSGDGYGPSDHSSFYIKNVPVMYAFTGGHNDYHTPNDDFDKINYKGLEKIENLLFSTVNEFDKIDKLKFQKTSEKNTGRPARFKVTLGIMPDYVFKEIKGLRIDAVTPGRPAYKAGILSGDIIIEINNKSVSDIYEYMHRLGEINPGDTVDVKVLRSKKELIFPVTF